SGVPGGGGGFGGRGTVTKSAPAREGRTKDREASGALGKKAEEEKLADDKKDAYFFDENRSRRLAIQLYRKLDVTQEWAENNYHHLRIQQQLADLVPPTGFWLDYARHDGKGPFLSKNLADASRNFTEMMLALAVIDLPFTAEKHDVKFEGN